MFNDQQDQKKGKSQGLPDELVNLIHELTIMAVMGLFAGFIATHKTIKEKPHLVKKYSPKTRGVVAGISLTAAGLFVLSAFGAENIGYFYRGSLLLLALWSFGFGLVLSFYSVFDSDKNKNRITTKTLDTKNPEFGVLEEFLKDPENIPVGISLKSQMPVLIPVRQVREHSLTSGATGQGKTTLLKTKVQHFIKHKRPVIIIDPKGEKSDVELVRSIAKSHGRENDFKLFSLSFPDESCSYNPLKVGSSLQRKDKLLSGLEITHEYYGSKADEFLGAIFDAVTYLQQPMDLFRMHQILIDKSVFSQLEGELRNLPETDELKTLLNQLASARKVNEKDLSGLIAQIGSLNSLELRALLTQKTQKPELDLVEVLQKGQIAYFQVNVNAYQKIAKKVGKLIVQDLRLVSNIFQSEQLKKEFDTAICFIDEFGSFATPDFSDFLKMARSSGIGCDLFFQGIADLNTVSKEFAEQILGNTATKFILRQDISSDVETWSSMAGTEDTMIESHQTERDPLTGLKHTGLGNLHEGKKVLIDFDVFKKLSPGRAVFIDKARHINDVVAIWNPTNKASAVVPEDLLQQSDRGLRVRKASFKRLTQKL